MKILFLAPQPFFVERGTPIAVRMAVETLARLGHSIDLLVYHEGAGVSIDGVRVVRIAGLPGVKQVPVGPSWKKLVCDVFFLAKFLQLVRAHRYDVIHAVEEAAAIAHATQWIHRTPFVVDMDSSIPSQLVETYPWLRPIARVLRAFEAFMLRGADSVVAVCQELAKIAERAGVPSTRVAVVEDAALEASDRARPTAKPLREEFPIEDDVPIVLYVGNLQKYQGVELLIEASARTEEPCAVVVVGGDAERIEGLRERARTLGLGERVHFAGPRPLEGLGDCLAQAEILASPRLHGVNTPMKIFSYLASGVPIVATDILSHTQVLNEDVAVLAPPEPDAYAQALDRLLADATLRSQLGSAGKALAEREFSREAFDRKLEAFYRGVEKRVGATPAHARTVSPLDRVGADLDFADERATARSWAKSLFARSILKQAKWKVLERLAGATEGRRCLDLGSDNGVVSLLFREKGGSWRSADLDPHAVESIRALVGDPVELLSGAELPYTDASFDLVVVVDLLEHLEDDVRSSAELARVVAPGGRIVACVPHDRFRSILRSLRLRLGLTDAKHGHVRPGYDRAQLLKLFERNFEGFLFAKAVGPCSELLDIVLSWALERKTGGPVSSKGSVVTHQGSASLGGAQRVYAALYPLFRVFAAGDLLFPRAPGALLFFAASRRRSS